MLSRQVGFQWNNTSFTEECQISGKSIQPGLGYAAVIADVPGMDLVFIDPELLKAYAPPAFNEYQRLRAEFPPNSPVEVMENAPQGIVSVSTLNIPVDAPELEAVVALMADEVIGLCEANGIAKGDIEDWAELEIIRPTYYYDVLASYGFVFKTADSEQYARNLIEKVVQPIVFAPHLASLGQSAAIEDALSFLAGYDYLNQVYTTRASYLLEAFV